MNTRRQALLTAAAGITVALAVTFSAWPAAQAASAWLPAAVALAAGLAGAAIVAWSFSRYRARRVDAIIQAAERRAAREPARPTIDYGEDEIGSVARAFDVAARTLGKRIDALSRDRAHMEAILAGMVEGVLALDEDGRLELVNRAAQSMLHVDASALGRPYLEVIRHPDITAQLAAALKGEDVEPRELPLGRDSSRLFMTRATPVVGTAGGGAVLVLHDITDLRRADRIRRDFVANISHELRTPLTAIRGYLEILLDDRSDPGQTHRHLEIVARHSHRMERLVSNLLRLARLDAQQESLDRVSCEIQQMFATVVTECEHTIEAKGHHIDISVQPEARTVNADPAKLHDIVRNLVENAVHYAPEQAEVRLETARREGYVDISVSNSGQGIPAGDLDRVFERFYRVDKARSHPGGVGLGLAIVKHLTELHGGRATVQNRPEGGVQFTISLPA